MSGAARSILITGCSSGIGAHAARALSARGWRVIATCRTDSDRAALAADGLHAVLMDYADTASIAAALDATLQHTGGRLDALFNNGAHALPGALEDLPTDGLRAIFEANLFGWHELTRRVIPVMRAQGAGRIVQNSSVLGIAALRWRGAYVATKFALEGMSDVLRMELRDTGIDVVLIEPGPVTSRLRANAIAHFERWIDWRASPRAAQYQGELLARLYEDRGPDRFELPPDAVTRTLLRALEARRPRPRYYVTLPAHVMALGRRLLPWRVQDWILSRI